VGPATFSPPDPSKPGNHDGARLLRDALQLKLRSGAGPFRSFGNIGVEPKVYQLVPLMMALRQETVRLLIADDVGVGKTVEAGLIARELLDRGEITRLAVLCPPHLIQQWHDELESKFHIQAECITASRASQIERNLPPGQDLFDYYPFVVISLDYIKSERNRNYFLQRAPDCVIVDEVHTCVSGSDRQLRQALLQELAARKERHLILLSATPYSGDTEAYHKLLGVLSPDFAQFAELSEKDAKFAALREKLRQFFVQRQRADIESQWSGVALGFPGRESLDQPYHLSPEWRTLYNDVISMLREEYEKGQRTSWFGMLALLRCLASSPDAAISALRTRAANVEQQALEDLEDESSSEAPTSDIAPGLGSGGAESPLVARLRALSGPDKDPKLAILVARLRDLLKEGYSPVIFCRYIATTEYLRGHLSAVFPDARIESASGNLTPVERKELIADIAKSERRVLIATDCLSEGVNLQGAFSAVIHYDLAWNPTRHDQRVGRVDRLGQPMPVIRSVMISGEDNPVDALVLKVIHEKARRIRKELGVSVAVPVEGEGMLKVLVTELLSGKKGQLSLDFGSTAGAQDLELRWVNAKETARKFRTIFAQQAIKPEEVSIEHERQKAVLGDAAAVQRFVREAVARLGGAVSRTTVSGVDVDSINLAHLAESVRVRLEEEAGLSGTILVTYGTRRPEGVLQVSRSHPLVSLLAEHLIEEGLENETGIISRCSASYSADTDIPTTIAILRIRHQLRTTYRNREVRTTMAEEAVAYCFRGADVDKPVMEPEGAVHPLALLDKPTAGNISNEVKTRKVAEALDLIRSKAAVLDAFAQARASELAADHARVRAASAASGKVEVVACTPVDIVGLYVVIPTL
jgi:superfamily II DNA or RNA helicase